MVAVIDDKAKLDKDAWVRVRQDVPGDLGLRETWVNAMRDLKPQGIIYILDGRTIADNAPDLVDELEQAVLVKLAEGIAPTASLHVFLNFSDHWGTTGRAQRGACGTLEREISSRLTKHRTLHNLRLAVTATQLSPHTKKWGEADRALRLFGADLAAG